MILDKKSSGKYDLWLDNAKNEGGVVLVNKPTGWTSFDVVAKLRNLFRIKKIGHAGTLDPLAEGLLIICCGRATKKIEQFQNKTKEYFAVAKLGATTITDDSEGDEENITGVSGISEEMIKKALYKFEGKFDQIPPKYSARKIKGKRAYKLARKNVDFQLNAKEVEIYSLNLHLIDMPFVHFSVKCSKGTYIRSLARDIGSELQTGAYLYSLVRTAIGEYLNADALSIDELIELSKNNNI